MQLKLKVVTYNLGCWRIPVPFCRVESCLLTKSTASWMELDGQFVLCTVPLMCVLVRPAHDHNLSFSNVPEGLLRLLALF
jgi:hypothetical protein